jgi:hypothetical protein
MAVNDAHGQATDSSAIVATAAAIDIQANRVSGGVVTAVRAYPTVAPAPAPPSYDSRVTSGTRRRLTGVGGKSANASPTRS